MLLQAQCSSSSIYLPHRFCQIPLLSPAVSFDASAGIGFQIATLGHRKNQRMAISAMDERSSSLGSERRRKVVEHICLLKAKEDLSDDEESDMLDHLYTTQYQMSGIVAISLGRVSAPNPENYSHALYMRFQRKENVAKFYENPFYLKVLKEHVMTYCHGLINVDYESEVEDEMLSIFRKGEEPQIVEMPKGIERMDMDEFNHGVEFVLLLSFVDSALGEPVEHALASLSSLMLESLSLIVQYTKGMNFNPSSNEYTHGLVTRFRSVEAFEIFMHSKEYKDLWLSNFQPIIRKALALHFSVDPVGTEVM